MLIVISLAILLTLTEKGLFDTVANEDKLGNDLGFLTTRTWMSLFSSLTLVTWFSLGSWVRHVLSVYIIKIIHEMFSYKVSTSVEFGTQVWHLTKFLLLVVFIKVCITVRFIMAKKMIKATKIMRLLEERWIKHTVFLVDNKDTHKEIWSCY